MDVRLSCSSSELLGIPQLFSPRDSPTPSSPPPRRCLRLHHNLPHQPQLVACACSSTLAKLRTKSQKVAAALWTWTSVPRMSVAGSSASLFAFLIAITVTLVACSFVVIVLAGGIIVPIVISTGIARCTSSHYHLPRHRPPHLLP